MIKFCALGDLHLKAADPLGYYVQGAARNSRNTRKLENLDSFLKYAVDNNCQLAVLCGDIFDTHTPPRWLVVEFSNVIAKYLGKIYIVYVPGNHDSTTQYSALTSEGMISHPGFRVAEDTFVTSIGDCHNIAFMPYNDAAAIDIITPDGLEDNVDLIFTHVYIEGANLSKSNKDLRLKEQGIKASFFPATYVILGDIHKRQVLSNRAIYTGASARISVDDAENDVGFIYGWLEEGELSYKYIDLSDIKIYRDYVSQFSNEIGADEFVFNDTSMAYYVEKCRGADVVEITFEGDEKWLRTIPFEKLRAEIKSFNKHCVVRLPKTKVVSDEAATRWAKASTNYGEDSAKSLSARWELYCKDNELSDMTLRIGKDYLEKNQPAITVSGGGKKFWLTGIELNGLSRYEKSTTPIPGPDGVTLIVGVNKDTPGLNSNGSGKSGILDAITWIITYTIPGKNRVMQAFGSDNYWGKLYLTDGTTELEIERGAVKGKGYLYVTVNGVTDKKMKIREAQELICQYLQIPDPVGHGVKLFYNVAHLSYAEDSGFSGASVAPSDKIKLLSKFIGLDPIETVVELLRKDLNPKREEHSIAVRLYEDVLSNIENAGDCTSISDKLPAEHSKALSRINKLVSNANARVKTLRKQIAVASKITDKRNELIDAKSELLKIVEEKDRRMAPLKDKYRMLVRKEEELETFHSKASLLEAKLTDTTATQEKLDVLRKENSELSTKLSDARLKSKELVKEQTSLKALLEDALVCPKCETELMLDEGSLATFDFKVIREKLASLEGSLKKDAIDRIKLERTLEDKTILIQQLLEEIAELKSQRREYEDLCTKIETYEKDVKDIDAVEAELDSLKVKYDALLAPIKEKIEDLKEQKFDEIPDIENFNIQVDKELDTIQKLTRIEERVKEHKKKVADLKETASRYSNKIKKLSEEIDRISDVVTELPRFRVAECMAAVPTIEAYTNEYLGKLGYDVELHYELHMVGSNMRIDTFVTDETEVGRPVETFSSGERNRFKLCETLALHKVAEHTSGFLVNWCGMDEVWEGLDESGRQALIHLLTDLNGQYLIISHSDIIDKVGSLIKVVRENNVSKIVA